MYNKNIHMYNLHNNDGLLILMVISHSMNIVSNIYNLQISGLLSNQNFDHLHLEVALELL